MEDSPDALVEVIKKVFEEIECDPPELPPGVSAAITCPAAPVQIQGTVDGKFLYFRARWDEWRLGVGDTEEDAIMGTQWEIGGEYENASWMPHKDAWELLLKGIERWRREKASNPTAP